MMFSRYRIVAVVTIVLILGVFLTGLPQTKLPQTKGAQFIIASWSFPDEYGQGIDEVRVYQNVSGEWDPLTPFGLFHTEHTQIEISDTATEINILVKGWFNNTVVGAADFDDGKNYLRHDVTLILMGDTIFYKQNFTYQSGTDTLDPMFYYIYDVVIPFSPIGGQIYIAVVDYEIYS